MNPNAQEFRPQTQPKLLHPHQIYADSEPPQTITLVQTLPFTFVPPQPTIITYVFSPQPLPLIPLYHHSPPPENEFPAIEQCFYDENPTLGHVEKRQKYSYSPVPPRMRRKVVKPFPVKQQKPKKTWKPKVLVPPAAWKTTVMIRHIPNVLRRSFMLHCLDNCSRKYSLAYDFLYLPMDFRSGDNLGYAFVNFTTPEAACTFQTVFDGFRWKDLQADKRPIASKKVCRITWARVQGKESLVRRFQRSFFNCNSFEFLPVLLDPPRDGSNANPPPPVIVGQLRPTPY